MNSKFTASLSSLACVPMHWALLLVVAVTLPVHASQVWQMNMVGDMYSEGRALTHPTPENPVYYYPMVLGYTEMGAKIAGAAEVPPSKRDIVHDLAIALATEGYRATREIEVPAKAAHPDDATPATTKAFSPPPTLLLVLSWGSLRPQKIDTAADVTDSTPPPVANQNQMLGLLAGKNFDTIVDFGQKSQDIWDGVQNDRYFVMVSAYDFNAYFQQHKKVVLWVAKMSVPTSGTTMAEVMPALIKNGASILGRETTGPKLLDVPNAPEGKVDVGTPTVVTTPPKP